MTTKLKNPQLFRRLMWIGALIVCVIFIPYLFSRSVSPWRLVRTSELKVEARQDGQGKIRVACYNIAHGRGIAPTNWNGETPEDRTQRLAKIAALLKDIDADIVVLNEVDFDSSWSHNVNQAEYIAKAAGYPHVVEQRNLDFRILFWTWRFGNAILSRYPIEGAQVVDFPGYSAWETLFAGKKRGIKATIEVDGHPVDVLGVHLSHRSEALRARSVNLLLGTGSNPKILAGDFNSTPPTFPNSMNDSDEGNAIARLDASEKFKRSPIEPPESAEEYTYHSEHPKSVIDWILVGEPLDFADYQVVSTLLSDHRPVVADIVVKH